MANIKIEGSTFMNWKDGRGINTARNFAGDPNKSEFKARDRYSYIAIPEEVARHLEAMNCWVGKTKPRDGEEEGFVPTYYIQMFVNFDSEFPPTVNLYSDGVITQLTKDTIGLVDDMFVESVDCTLNPWTNPKTGKTKVFCNVLWIKQNTSGGDPFKKKYQDMANGYGG